MEPANSGISRDASFGSGTIQITSENKDLSNLWRFWKTFALDFLYEVIVYDKYARYIYLIAYFYKPALYIFAPLFIVTYSPVG